MTVTAPPVPVDAVPSGRRRPERRRASRVNAGQSRYGYVFVSGYTLLLLAFGLLPTLYALYLSFTRNGAFVGFDNFVKVFGDYRFLPAVMHVALYVLFWLVSLIVLVVVLAIVVHGIRVRWLGNTARFLFYIPGAIAGASSVLLWLFVLDPSVSPVSALLHAMGYESLVNVVAVGNLPVVFTIIAFWAGAGSWIVIMYGALNNIPVEVMEAARIDGAGPVQTAWHIQLPMLTKWISYMGVMSLAAGTQLFVEPKILAQATKNIVPEDYSLNQLAYLYAFRQNDFSGSAAISVLLLVVALGLSAIFIFRGKLFERD
ncbi:multiple sugar transport system permease protein [Agromyces terreus]|uniref:Multiple sugar transport system permease protein n=1 Tax=Agromyces terreus TaxID=424795 RepID=A0A9X2GYG0_9MICO|nr:sugar ABC transporter permease [Agromyces terreus]MCP2369721.1 multiple sugar transport system permease protein [Agromyces terreus]